MEYRFKKIKLKIEKNVRNYKSVKFYLKSDYPWSKVHAVLVQKKDEKKVIGSDVISQIREEKNLLKIP